MKPRTMPAPAAWKSATLLAVILLATVVVYSTSFANGFLNFDDPANITENLLIRDLSFHSVSLYFTTPLIGMYSPLTYLSYAIDFRWAGLDPYGYHLTNLCLHLLCVGLVFVSIRRLTRNLGMGAIVAALFAVHPMNVAGVTPLSLRSALLCSSFYLAAFYAYVRYVEEERPRFLWISFAMFVAASLSKSAAVVFPLTMFVTDYYLEKRFSVQTLIRKVPFLVVSLLVGILTLAFREDTLTLGRVPYFPLFERLLLAAYSLVLYAGKLIVPVGLSSYYPYPDNIGGHLPLQVYVAPLVIAAVVWMAARKERYRRAVVFGLGFFIVNLFLVLKIVPLGAEWMSDRYVYLPSIGIFFLVAKACRVNQTIRRSLSVTVPVVVIALGVVAAERNGEWKDSITFYTSILGRYPDSAIAYCNRGAARLRDLGDPEGAISDCDSAIRLEPGYADSYYNRGTARVMLHRVEEALADSSEAIRLNGGKSEYYQLRADIRLSLRDYKGAAEDSERALALNPAGPQAYMAHASRAIARISQNDTTGALADFNEAVRLNPREAVLYQNRGNAFAMKGDDKSAMADYNTAIALSPSLASAYYYRGLLKQRLADSAGGCGDFQKSGALGLEQGQRAFSEQCRARSSLDPR